MASWKVVLNEQFEIQLLSTTQDIQQRLNNASNAQSRRDVERHYPQFTEFKAFANVVMDLVEGKTDPTTVLKYRGLTTARNQACVLTVGRWQASFLLDPSNKVCTGVSMTEIASLPIRALEAIKNRFRRPLE